MVYRAWRNLTCLKPTLVIAISVAKIFGRGCSRSTICDLCRKIANTNLENM